MFLDREQDLLNLFLSCAMTALPSAYVYKSIARFGLDAASTILSTLKYHAASSAASAALLTILLIGAPWLYNNYREFLAIGPGGMPYNVRGWLMALFFKIFERDTLSTVEYDRETNKDRWLDLSKEALPTRQGPRPNSGFHVVPVRQFDQLPSAEMKRVSLAFSPEVIVNLCLTWLASSVWMICYGESSKNSRIWWRSRSLLTRDAMTASSSTHPSQALIPSPILFSERSRTYTLLTILLMCFFPHKTARQVCYCFY